MRRTRPSNPAAGSAALLAASLVAGMLLGRSPAARACDYIPEGDSWTLEFVDVEAVDGEPVPAAELAAWAERSTLELTDYDHVQWTRPRADDPAVSMMFDWEGP